MVHELSGPNTLPGGHVFYVAWLREALAKEYGTVPLHKPSTSSTLELVTEGIRIGLQKGDTDPVSYELSLYLLASLRRYRDMMLRRIEVN